MLNVLLAGALAVSMVGVSAPEVAAEAAQPEITVQLVSYNGSGCQPGTAAVAISPDQTAFTITYSDYLAQIGPGAGASDFRKNCGVTVDVQVPAGFTYSVVSADYRGYAYLNQGANAVFRANYYFQGNPEDQWSQRTLRGPLDDNWQVSEDVDIPVFAPCGGTRFLEVNTELRVNRGSSPASATSLITMDSEDHEFSTTYYFDVRAC